jgi:hypothetical protein
VRVCAILAAQITAGRYFYLMDAADIHACEFRKQKARATFLSAGLYVVAGDNSTSMNKFIIFPVRVNRYLR